MSKAITLEMLHAMSPDQRKTLHGNATRMDTPASRAVLELLAQDGLMSPPKASKTTANGASARRKVSARAARGASETSGKKATFGRQA